MWLIEESHPNQKINLFLSSRRRPARTLGKLAAFNRRREEKIGIYLKSWFNKLANKTNQEGDNPYENHHRRNHWQTQE